MMIWTPYILQNLSKRNRPDLNESKMKFPAEMISQPPIVIVNTEVSRTYLNNSLTFIPWKYDEYENSTGCIFCLEVSSSPPFSKLNRAIKINDFKRKLNDFRILGKFKQDIGKCKTKSQIFHSTLPPHLTRGRGGG